MKKKLFGLLLLVFVISATQAQNIRLNAYGNYVFDDNIDNYYSSNQYFNSTIKGGFLWGLGLEFRLKGDYGIELLYQRLDTHAPTSY